MIWNYIIGRQLEQVGGFCRLHHGREYHYHWTISALSAVVYSVISVASLSCSFHRCISSQAHIIIVFNCNTSSLFPPLPAASRLVPSINSRHRRIQCGETKSHATLIQEVKLHTYKITKIPKGACGCILDEHILQG